MNTKSQNPTHSVVTENLTYRTGTALVTGGSRRIGAAMVEALAFAGFNVVIHYANSDEYAGELMNKLCDLGVQLTAIEADLTCPKQTGKMFDQAYEELGAISLLINNASVFKEDNPTTLNYDAWDQHFDLHLKAPTHLASRVYNQKEVQSGEINALVVNMIDQRVLRPNPRFFSYTLSKSALWTATQTMAQAFAPKMRVNAIGPGPTLPNERQAITDFQNQVDGLILKKGPALDEFGRTILYLWQSPSITGQMIALDGGQHLAWQTPDIEGINE